jgi:ligand-binding sensor domain-containing protein
MPLAGVGQQYFIKSYSADNGLPTRIISDACQDQEGFIWFATYFGISKYDGFSFVNYDSLNGLPDQHFRKLRCDEKGILWAVPYTNTGKIVNYKNNVWANIELPHIQKPYAYITSFDVIYKGNEPVICIGSYAGIDLYADKKWTHINVSDQSRKNIVYSVISHEGAFYLGTTSGLLVLRDNLTDWSLNKKINPKNETILAVKFDDSEPHNDKMWILTNHSLAFYNNNKVTVASEDFFLEDIDIAHFPFIGIRNGDVLFGSNFSKFLLKISEDQIIPLGVKNGFSSNGASSLFIDRESNIWFTDSRGIDKISDITLVNYYESSGMP